MPTKPEAEHFTSKMHQMITLAHLKHSMQGVGGGPAIQPNLESWIGRKSLRAQPSETSESQQADLRCGWIVVFGERKAWWVMIGRKKSSLEPSDKTPLLWRGEASLLASRSPANALIEERRVLELVMIGHGPPGFQIWDESENLGLGCGWDDDDDPGPDPRPRVCICRGGI